MTTMQTVLLPVGADLYAVPIGWIREVLAAPAITRLVTAPAVLLGLMNLRGEIVPLLDTAALLGVGTVGTGSFAAVMHTSHGPAALAVSGLPQRAELGSPTGPSELPGTAGTYRLDKRVAVLLDLAVLLTPERIGGHELHSVGVSVEVS
ncbi:MAG: purine-binding chemotaxis protein CheW [Pseudonocardiales bacterium]|nr:purine-binding chemotaxis protein CheW [Pseudonocardiales bacterium]